MSLLTPPSAPPTTDIENEMRPLIRQQNKHILDAQKLSLTSKYVSEMATNIDNCK